MKEEVVKYVLSQYLSDTLVEIIINEIKAAEGGESDDVDK
jgi:hypothetical protein